MQYKKRLGQHFLVDQNIIDKLINHINPLKSEKFLEIGPGDGGTVIIPSSHKSNIQHPEYKENKMKKNRVTSAENMTGSLEVYLDAGDALLFVDSLCHGSAKRTNKGERRIAVYRYGPSWGFFRHPYRPSTELLKRLTKFQRKIVMPHEKVLTPNI